MLEIFKTNVTESHQAELLIGQIQASFIHCEVTFDLDDCDRILRVKSPETINPQELINLLGRWGFHAELLQDEILQENSQLQIRQ